MELVHSELSSLPPALRAQSDALLFAAFPNMAPVYDYGPETPEILLMIEDHSVVAHLAAYERDVLLGDAPQRIGLVGGVAVTPAHRGRGHVRSLLAATHVTYRQRGLAFSVLFADLPAVYHSSGYREMTNLTRVTEDGVEKEFVYRGGMAAALSDRPWPGLLLNLHGPAV